MTRSSPFRAPGSALLVAFIAAVATACHSDAVIPVGNQLAFGTWGGDNVGVIVSDSGMHVHVGCTLGDALGLVPLDADGKFDIAGSYMLRAYPVAVGPILPAEFSGHVVGDKLTLVVAVNDTVQHKLQVLGPVTVQFGKQPQMGPCPICRRPAVRLR